MYKEDGGVWYLLHARPGSSDLTGGAVTLLGWREWRPWLERERGGSRPESWCRTGAGWRSNITVGGGAVTIWAVRRDCGGDEEKM